MRPFSEGITGISRLVRDVTRELGKSVKLEVAGEGTRVDRDILERLEEGTMPCDGEWPEEQIAQFRHWVEAGMPA